MKEKMCVYFLSTFRLNVWRQCLYSQYEVRSEETGREGRGRKDFDTDTVSANVGECFQETFEHEKLLRISSQVKHVCTIICWTS